jgi:hypothetical protein
MRLTVDNAESAREESHAELRGGGVHLRGVSDSKSLSSGGVAENTASAANVSFKVPKAGTDAQGGSDDECGECAHGTDGSNNVQAEATREKGSGEIKEIKSEEGKDSKEGKTNPFMHVEESRSAALSSDNLLVC